MRQIKEFGMNTVFITGASRGIGKAIALEFAKAGCRLAINCRKDREALSKTAEEIEKTGASCIMLVGDVSDPDFARTAFSEVVRCYGSLDILVNNAGIAKVGLFTEMTDADWRQVSGTNLDGVIWCSREAAKIMLHEKKGRIINISSMCGQAGASCEVLYSATKGAVDAFTKALAKELAPSNIQVNAVSCGVIDTEMNNNLTDVEKTCLADEIPAGRFGTAEEVAKLVLLVAQAPEYLTGQIIRIDGGMI